MTWIKTIPLSQADAELDRAVKGERALYPVEYINQVPGLPDDDAGGIAASHSLIPDALYHAFATFGVLMDPKLPLTRREHELIATMVSLTNCTHYCSVSHLEFLRRVTLDDELIAALKKDYKSANLNEKEMFLAEYAVQITKDATKITKTHHQKLRDFGYDDTGILQITQIACWFNYINRMADSLGVARD